jgi:hypothetical protein
MGEIFRGAGIPQLDGFLMAGDNPKGVFYVLDVDSDPLDSGGEGWSELIAIEESSGQQKRLITMINEERASLGLPEATRADLRFSVNTPGEVFILNKQDGVLRMLIPIPEPASLLLGGLALITFAVVHKRPRRRAEEPQPERLE